VWKEDRSLIRSIGTAFAVLVLACSLSSTALAQTRLAPLAGETAAMSTGFSSANAGPLSSAGTLVSERAADQAALNAVASLVPQRSVTVDETQMWDDVQAPRKESPLRRFAHTVISRTSQLAMSLTRSALRFIGTPYVFGGTTPSGFDCSGYVQHVFAMLGLRIPRTADAQYYAGQAIHGQMTQGDLVFFQTYLPGVSHVGIYLGHGRFVHASSHGVMISSLSDSYWASRYVGAKRLLVAKL
jgi:cell wall-associated NlpC family hydrolase